MRILVKRCLKRAAGLMASAAAPFAPARTTPAACILVYHRVAEIGFVDSQVDDWNVSPAVFERQIAALTQSAEIIPLHDLSARLASGVPPPRPLVCLTFDDGFENFFTHALPVLQRHRAPATLFVVSSAIGTKGPMRFDGWARKHAREMPAHVWRALNWPQIEACANTALIAIGAHSHRHLNGLECSPGQLREEAECSFAILSRRLGEAFANVYSYPYGSARLGQASGAYREAVRRAGFKQAFTTDLGLASAKSDPHLIPRVEAHALDTPRTLLAKAKGVLFPYLLTDRLRSARRFRADAERDSVKRFAH